MYRHLVIFLMHLPLIKGCHILSFFLLQTKGVVVAASLATAEKNGRPFFKIIDAAVVVAYTPLLINDRFCSRTSSLHCRQCCHSSASLSLWSKQPRPYMKNKNCLQKKKGKKENARRAFAHTKRERRDRQTRFIYSNNQPTGNTFL